jgi:hypothetical protein
MRQSLPLGCHSPNLFREGEQFRSNKELSQRRVQFAFTDEQQQFR